MRPSAHRHKQYSRAEQYNQVERATEKSDTLKSGNSQGRAKRLSSAARTFMALCESDVRKKLKNGLLLYLKI